MHNITLIVINDGNGDQCGYSYAKRLGVMKLKPYAQAAHWLNMVRHTSNWLKEKGENYNLSVTEMYTIAAEIAEYYAQHTKEGA